MAKSVVIYYDPELGVWSETYVPLKINFHGATGTLETLKANTEFDTVPTKCFSQKVDAETTSGKILENSFETSFHEACGTSYLETVKTTISAKIRVSIRILLLLVAAFSLVMMQHKCFAFLFSRIAFNQAFSHSGT